MNTIRTCTHNLLCLLTTALISGCGGGGGSSAPSAAVSGAVVAGPVNGAKITVKTPTGRVVAGLRIGPRRNAASRPANRRSLARPGPYQPIAGA